MTMQHLNRHKEILLLLAIAFILGFVSIDLFGNQQKNSELLNSGTTIVPSTLSGRAACKIPALNKSDRSKKTDVSTETKKLKN